MAERVAAYRFRDAGLYNGFMDNPLNYRRAGVMPPLLAGLLVFPAAYLRKYPLPVPVFCGIGIFFSSADGSRTAPNPSARSLSCIFFTFLRCSASGILSETGKTAFLSFAPFPHRTVISFAEKSMSYTRRRRASIRRISVP